MQKGLITSLVCASTIIGGALSCPFDAKADCTNLEVNEQWFTLMRRLNESYKAKQTQEALRTAKELEGICDRSPLLNYMIAALYRDLGNKDKQLFHLQKATLETRDFKVDSDLLTKIWSDKYIAENPEADPANIAARKAEYEENIQNLKNEIEQRDSMIAAQKDKNTKLTTKLVEKGKFVKDTKKQAASKGLWTGVAMAGIGLGIGVAGGVLQYKNDKKIDFNDDKAKANPSMTTYVYTGMLIGGAALLLAGSIMTGIMGYQYTHAAKEADDIISFAVTPTSASLAVQF